MENTKIWAALQTFTTRDMRFFGRFVASPYFNRNPALERLLAYFFACLRSGVVPSKSDAFDAVQPGQPFSDAALRLACSDLLSLIEAYWVQRERKEDQTQFYLELARIQRRRGLLQASGSSLRKAQQLREKKNDRDAAWFDFQFEAGMEHYQAATAARRYDAFNLQETSDALDAAYLIRKLRHVCLALSHQTVFEVEYQFGPLDALFDWINEAKLTRHTVLALYYYACRFLLEPGAEKHFSDFRRVMAGNPDTLPAGERRTLYLLAINFGIKKGNEEGQHWYRETFELYKDALAQELLLENGRISRFAFNNIIGLALRLNEIEWAEQFLETYAPLMEARQRSVTIALTRAKLAYARRNYEEAQDALQIADYRDFLNNLVARILQIKIYYETDAYELLEHHLTSTERYVRRHRAAGYHRENALNLIQLTRSLMRLQDHQPQTLNALKQEIIGAPVLTEREWLMEQLSAFGLKLKAES